jgi:hypothetical protein
LNDLDIDNPPAIEADDAEDARPSIGSMVPIAIDPNDNFRLCFRVIFRGDLPGEDDDQDLRGLNCCWRGRD